MKTGFIGFGNMAGAMAEGMIRFGGADPSDITASARDLARLRSRAEKLGVGYTTDNKQLAGGSDVLFLAVKPHLMDGVIQEIKSSLHMETVIVSVAAGVGLADLEIMFGSPVRLVRALPNTPAMVGQGMTLYNLNDQVTDQDEKNLLQILNGFGRALRIREDQFAGAGSMTGCSPAFLYMLMEAMADAAVLKGLQRDAAYLLAAQTVKGSAQMMLESGLHPGQLKDMVTSPGGTTIEGVRTLEKLGLRSAIMEAIIAAAEKTGK